MTPLVSEATMELQNALLFVLSSIQTNEYSSASPRMHRQCNTYERKRAFRRLQRALLSLEEIMDDHQLQQQHQQHQQQHQQQHKQSTVIASGILSNESTILTILIDILTEIPNSWFLQPTTTTPTNTNTNATTTTSTAANNSNTNLDQLYHDEIVSISCSIIHKYALLPLHES